MKIRDTENDSNYLGPQEEKWKAEGDDEKR